MALSYIDTHSTDALARIAEQYKDSTRLRGLISSIADQVQDIDDAIWELATERYLYSDAEIGDTTVNYVAEGDQLDVLGRILNLTRQNMTDAQYRLALKGQVKMLKSSGTVEELIAIFAAARPDATITVANSYPAGFTLTLTDDVIETALSNILVKFVHNGRAAGVYGILEWQETADAGCLILSDAASYPETSTTTGLGDVSDPLTGGALTGAAAEPT